MPQLEQLRNQLTAIRAFSFSARSGPNSKMDWNGRSEGSVDVKTSGNSVIFFETGEFKREGTSKGHKQRNVYRWEFSQSGVNVYQERRDEPVFLVKLIETVTGWTSEEAHHCGNDLYSLDLEVMGTEIHSTWRISGPKKDEILTYVYL